MGKMNYRTILVVMAVAAVAIAPVPSIARSKAPLGHQLMCLRTPAECKGGGASIVDATPKLMAILQRVNAAVNSAITPRKDGSVDVWSAGATSGDCEDYVLAKRRALIKAGLPASSLRIAYVKTRAGVDHAILVVKTSVGDFVLDNLRQSVEPLDEVGYRVISISGADPMDWT